MSMKSLWDPGLLLFWLEDKQFLIEQTVKKKIIKKEKSIMDTNFLVDFNDGVAKFNLSGRLDTTNAPALSDELKELVGQNVEKIVFLANDLEYISSAGLRVIVFAKQKMGVDTQVFIVSPQQDVLDVIKMSGFDSFLKILDSFDD